MLAMRGGKVVSAPCLKQGAVQAVLLLPTHDQWLMRLDLDIDSVLVGVLSANGPSHSFCFKGRMRGQW